MCSRPPPSGNRSQKQPPAFASTERLRASREKVCTGSHQPPTPSVSAVYTVAGGALIAAVFRTRKPAAVLSITSPRRGAVRIAKRIARVTRFDRICRSEEHTSELQSRRDLVCRLLLEKKKIICVRYTHEAGRNTPNVSRSCYST